MILSIEEIKAKYPNQWVLVGNPILDEPDINGSIVSKLVRGIVLFASPNKREIGFRANEFRNETTNTVCIFTGEIPKNRLFLL